MTGGGLPAEIWQAVMTEIHEGLPVESLGSFVFDASGAVPHVVSSGGADGASDPLAAALSSALGQPQPEGAAPAPQDPAMQPQGEPGRRLQDASTIQSGGTVPTFPAETSSTDGMDTEISPDDPLAAALRGIDGVY